MNHTLGDPFSPLHPKLKRLALDLSHVADLTAGLGIEAGFIHDQPDRLALAIEVAALMQALAIDPAQDLLLSTGPLDDLDHATPTPKFGSKVGIDATQKGPLEGRQREWPPDIVMSPEVKELVNSKWSEYGIE